MIPTVITLLALVIVAMTLLGGFIFGERRAVQQAAQRLLDLKLLQGAVEAYREQYNEDRTSSLTFECRQELFSLAHEIRMRESL